MSVYVQDLLNVHALYAARNMSLSFAALAGSAEFVENAHYPKNDVVDVQNGTRFFYHAHPAHERIDGEHGHFHIFVDEPAKPANAPPNFVHLAGISLDDKGTPLRLFTTNQWVTGERYVRAEKLVGALASFQLSTLGRMAPVARWINAMMRWCSDDIYQLLLQRDARLQSHQQGLREALRDRRWHILSQQRLSYWNRLSKETSI